MRIFAVTTKPSPEIVVEHRGEKLVFRGTVFRKSNLMQSDSIFFEINDYWMSRPIDVQDKIFNIYKQIDQGFSCVRSSVELAKFLNEAIIELLRIHDLSHIRIWLATNPMVYIPESFEDEYVENIDTNFSQEKTYTKSDYLDLLTLAMFLRVLCPIWGEFSDSVTKTVGKSNQDEQAMRLLADTGLMKNVAMIKLHNYINAYVKTRSSNLGRIVKGHSSEDLSYDLLGQICVRRLTIAPFNYGGLDEDVAQTQEQQPKRRHLVATIYKFMHPLIFGNNSGDEVIEEKNIDDTEKPDNGKRSILESYRYRQELDIGNLKEYVKALVPSHAIAEILAPGIDHHMLQSCIESARQIDILDVGMPQVQMLSWIMATVISPRAIMYLPSEPQALRFGSDYKTGAYRDIHGNIHNYFDQNPQAMVKEKNVLIDSLGVAQAVLWHWGHKYLSLLITAYPEESDGNMVVATTDAKNHIPRELKDEINRIYPYSGVSVRRNQEEVTPESNRVLDLIDLIADELMSKVWIHTASPEMEVEVLGRNFRRFSIRSSIKPDLASLIIDIGSRKHIQKRKKPF